MRGKGKHGPRVRGLRDPAIAKRLIEIRRDFGLLQTAFGERVGLSQAVVSSYERGTSIPKAIAIAIAAVYGVSLEWLTKGAGEKYLPIDKVKITDRDLELLQFIKRQGSIYTLMHDYFRLQTESRRAPKRRPRQARFRPK